MSSALSQTQSRSLLRRLVEGQAYRQLLVGNIRGVGIQMLSNVTAKGRMARDLEHSLHLMEQVENIHRELGGEDLVSEVRPRIDRVPMPESQLERELSRGLCSYCARSGGLGARGGRSPGAGIHRGLYPSQSSSGGPDLLGPMVSHRAALTGTFPCAAR